MWQKQREMNKTHFIFADEKTYYLNVSFEPGGGVFLTE